MEYCGGGDLLQRIQQHKTRPFRVDDVGVTSLKGLVVLSIVSEHFFSFFFSLFLDLEMVCSNVFRHTPHPPQTGSAQRLEIQGTAASDVHIHGRARWLKFTKPI